MIWEVDWGLDILGMLMLRGEWVFGLGCVGHGGNIMLDVEEGDL